MPFQANDRRRECQGSFADFDFDDFQSMDPFLPTAARDFSQFRIRLAIGGTVSGVESTHDFPGFQIGIGNAVFGNTRPQNALVPFLARRKAMAFEENVSLGPQSAVTGTFQHLYSRIDKLTARAHPRHELYHAAIMDIVELPVTTTSSPNGKKAGIYINREDQEEVFITLDQMGDGVVELVGLIVELCLERRKIFVLEEPETNLHPAGLKALLGMIRESADHNQFIIATHSNIVPSRAWLR
jgi:hypothetical protein